MQTDPEPHDASPGLPGPGDMVAGKYRIENVIGEGGMGVVVAATHVALDERVAIKFLRREVTRPETTARFLREARAAAKIKSEHVVKVTDVGAFESGSPYMVMEFLEGEDLGALIHERGPLPFAEAVGYLLEACEAVAEAHALGIVHRDLKPANLFRARRPGGQTVVKVVDFGISKLTGATRDEAAMTHSSSWLGSPLYMSPEQMKSARDVDARTDIWSLGLILFQLITGRVPFDAPSLPELCAKVIHEDPEPIEELRPDTPEGLAAVIRRCLQKSPDERYLNVAELAMDLAPFAPERSRASVERIVSVIEDAGLIRPSRIPRAPMVSIVDRDSEPSPVRDGGVGGTTNPTDRAPIEAARTSTPPPPPVPEEPQRRRLGVLGGLLLFLVAVGLGGGAAYLAIVRFRPLPRPPAPLPSASVENIAPLPVASASAPVVTPASAAPPAASSAAIDAGAIDAGVIDAGVIDAGAKDAGAVRRRGLPARRPLPGNEPSSPSPEPVPQPVSPSTQTCFQTLPDGTVKQVPCP